MHIYQRVYLLFQLEQKKRMLYKGRIEGPVDDIEIYELLLQQFNQLSNYRGIIFYYNYQNHIFYCTLYQNFAAKQIYQPKNAVSPRMMG